MQDCIHPKRIARAFIGYLYLTFQSLHNFYLVLHTMRHLKFILRRNRMDWIYLLLTLAFFGLSVSLIFGIEKLRRPS
jgi:hypothetical protein